MNAREQIARALDENFNPNQYPIMSAMFLDYADAVLATPAFRLAKAEAWDEGYAKNYSEQLLSDRYPYPEEDKVKEIEYADKCGRVAAEESGSNPYRKELGR